MCVPTSDRRELRFSCDVGFAARALRADGGVERGVVAEAAAREPRSDEVHAPKPAAETEALAPAEPAQVARRALGLPEGRRIVTSVSRLVPRKGMDDLIRAAAPLAGDRPDLVLAIAGAGRDRERLSRLGKATEAEARFRELISKGGDGYDVRQRLGDLYLDRDQPDRAIAELAQAKRLDPDRPEPYERLAKLYTKQKREDDALRELAAAAHLDIMDAELTYGLVQRLHAARIDLGNSQISGRSLSLTADTARRRRENVALVDLVSPKLEDAASTVVQAREGVWNSETEVLELVGDVVMTDAAGYTFTSQRTRMFVKDNRVEGEEPLNGVGPIGEVRANAYDVLDDGNRIVLKGKVWTRFTPKKKRGTPAGGDR